MIVAVIVSILLFGLFLRQLGKTLEDIGRHTHHTHTTNYIDNRQYHHTEVHHHNDTAKSNERDAANFRF